MRLRESRRNTFLVANGDVLPCDPHGLPALPGGGSPGRKGGGVGGAGSDSRRDLLLAMPVYLELFAEVIKVQNLGRRNEHTLFYHKLAVDFRDPDVRSKTPHKAMRKSRATDS